MFGLAAIPSTVRFVAFFFLPESPRWLVGKGKMEKARKVLQKVGVAVIVALWAWHSFKILEYFTHILVC